MYNSITDSMVAITIRNGLEQIASQHNEPVRRLADTDFEETMKYSTLAGQVTNQINFGFAMAEMDKDLHDRLRDRFCPILDHWLKHHEDEVKLPELPLLHEWLDYSLWKTADEYNAYCKSKAFHYGLAVEVEEDQTAESDWPGFKG